MDHLFSLLLIVELIGTFFIFTLSLVFEDVAKSTILFVLQIASLIIAITEITINFIHQRTISGRKLKILREIVSNYAKNQLAMDILNLFILIVSMSTSHSIFDYFRILSFSKFPQIMDRLEKL